MKDVADRAGVSAQTVSNLVNGRFEQMSETTRARVEGAMQALGYHPDVSAQGLRSARTRTLGFLVLDEHQGFLADPLTGLLMAGVGDVARASSFGILVQGGRPSADADDLLAPFHRRRIDGAFVLLSGDAEVRRAHVDRLLDLDVDFVLFDELIDDASLLSVRAAERDGSRRLTEHLLERGHRRIGFIAAKVPWAVIEQRYLGYRDAMSAAKLRPSKSLELFEGTWEPEGGARMAAKLLSVRPPPTAIIGTSDLLAIGAMHHLRQRGVRVPDDIAVAGFDDFTFSPFVAPPLTTVAVPAYEMGKSAATMLIDQIEGRQPLVRHAVFGVELRIREST